MLTFGGLCEQHTNCHPTVLNAVGQFPHKSAIMAGFSNGLYPFLKATERILLIVNLTSNFATALGRRLLTFLFIMSCGALASPAVLASPREGGEAALKLPDLSQVTFLGIDGHKLLLVGLLFCFLGLMFGLAIYIQLKNLPVHRSMREISELIYETCKTYLITQGRFILILWIFIAVIVVAYFGVLHPVPGHPVTLTVPMILLFSLVGIGGSYGVAWFGICVNTFSNSRAAFSSPG